MNVLKLSNVSKSLKGKQILNNINIEMQSGNIYGLVGKNGSGKTMLIRTIAGLMKPDSGYIMYNQKRLYYDMDFIPNLGVIVENIGLYPEFSGLQNLKILANVNKKITEKDMKLAIERVGLDPNDKQKIKKYSLGMKQRLTLAQAIMEKPDILLLDEPTNSLDDTGIDLIRDICLEESSRGAIVMIASHNKLDIEILCNEQFLVNSGKLTKGVE